MERVTLSERLTSTYVDRYSHLDEWGQDFTFKMLQSRPVRAPEGFDDGGTVSVRIIGSKKLDQNRQARVLAQNLSYSGCSHSYDCCGCASVSASIHKGKRGVFTALLRTSYNY